MRGFVSESRLRGYALLPVPRQIEFGEGQLAVASLACVSSLFGIEPDDIAARVLRDVLAPVGEHRLEKDERDVVRIEDEPINGTVGIRDFDRGGRTEGVGRQPDGAGRPALAAETARRNERAAGRLVRDGEDLGVASPLDPQARVVDGHGLPRRRLLRTAAGSGGSGQPRGRNGQDAGSQMAGISLT